MNHSNYKITNCSCFDWKSLTDLISEIFPDVLSNSISYMLITWKKNIRLAKIDNRIVGFLIYSNKESDIAWLELIGVRKDVRKRGIGKHLLEAFEEDAAKRGYSRIELAVEKNSSAAIRLYESFGYSLLPREGKKFTYFKEIYPRSINNYLIHSDRTIFSQLSKKAYWKVVYWIFVNCDRKQKIFRNH
jgi:ribosomal protein S18 acetylase RimI-like enzyme